MKRLALAYIPLALWAVGVLLLGSLDLGGVTIPSGGDKVAHLVLYGLGGGLAARAGRSSGRGSGWPGLFFVLLVAAADEVHQAGLPHRSGDPADWLADASGALVAFIIIRRSFGAGAGGT